VFCTSNVDTAKPDESLSALQDLISSLLALSTVTLPLGTLNLCLEQLTAYISRFKNRLASKHVLHLKRLYRLLQTLKGLLSNWQEQNSSEVMTVDGLLSRLGGKLEEINFLEIQSYLRKSKAWHNLAIRPSRVHLPMTNIASKENHIVLSEDESEG
jgi:hypothetical protein